MSFKSIATTALCCAIVSAIYVSKYFTQRQKLLAILMVILAFMLIVLRRIKKIQVVISGSVLVTGASSGIGKATAFYLAEKGFRVFCGIRKEEDANKLKKEWKKLITTDNKSEDNTMKRKEMLIEPIKMEVTCEDSVSDALASVRSSLLNTPSSFPALKNFVGIVNNAGVVMQGPLELTSTEQLKKVFDVNVVGLCTVSRTFMPLFRDHNHSEGKRIIHIGSILGFTSVPYLGAYCATKWAVEALAIALRNETCKEGIRVATINPGLVETEIVKSNVQSELQAIEATPDELKCKYARFFVDFNKQAKKVKEGKNPVSSGIKPIEVAKVIFDALTMKEMENNYVVGKEKYLLSFFLMLPSFVQDFIYQKAFN